MTRKDLLVSTSLKPGWQHGFDGEYDANDPDTKAAVQAAITAALEAAQEEHDAEVERLKGKNNELLDKLKKARAGGDSATTGEIERLEREVEDSSSELRKAQTELRDAKRQLKDAERDRDAAKASLETETGFNRNLITENSLTAALAENNIAPQFLEAAKALIGKGVTVKEVDGERLAFVNDKPVSDYVKEWAASDAGKAFIKAPANGGGGANGTIPNGNSGAKKLADLSEPERLELARTNPQEWQRIRAEAGLTDATA